MKKRILSFLGVAAFVVASLSSCMTVNSGASITNTTLGSKTGVAESTIFLGLWSSKGEQNDLNKAAENGGIKKVNHVEYVNKAFLGGLVIKHTTRVYGD